MYEEILTFKQQPNQPDFIRKMYELVLHENRSVSFNQSQIALLCQVSHTRVCDIEEAMLSKLRRYLQTEPNEWVKSSLGNVRSETMESWTITQNPLEPEYADSLE